MAGLPTARPGVSTIHTVNGTAMTVRSAEFVKLFVLQCNYPRIMILCQVNVAAFIR